MAFVREARMQILCWKTSRACVLVRLKHRSKELQVAISNDAILAIWIRDVEYPLRRRPEFETERQSCGIDCSCSAAGDTC